MDRIPLNDLARLPSDLARAREEALVRVARSGWFLRGPETAAFEQELAGAVGVAAAVGVANGTSALELALRGLGCGGDGAVLTAANAGGYATTAIRNIGLRPWYADVDERTLGLSAETVERALSGRTERPQAVVVTHLYGQLAEIESIVALCAGLGVPVVEDCAQAIGAERGGARAGSFGDVGSFSFYPTKNLGAVGDAGAVVSDDEDVLRRVRALAQYGWSDKYRVAVAGGGNSRLDELQAAVLRLGLPRLNAANARRRDVLRRYEQALPPGAGRVVGGPRIGTDHVAHLGVLWVEDRERVVARLDDRGIDTAVHYPVPDHRQPAWTGSAEGAVLPVTDAAAEHVLSLPLFPGLTELEVDRISDALGTL